MNDFTSTPNLKGAELQMPNTVLLAAAGDALHKPRILCHWMRMVTVPNQSSVPKAFLEFEIDGRMKASSFCNCIIDVVEELVKFTWLTHGRSDYLTDRYSERVESTEELSKRVNQKQI